jgi:hypothetical protein
VLWVGMVCGVPGHVAELLALHCCCLQCCLLSPPPLSCHCQAHRPRPSCWCGEQTAAAPGLTGVAWLPTHIGQQFGAALALPCRWTLRPSNGMHVCQYTLLALCGRYRSLIPSSACDTSYLSTIGQGAGGMVRLCKFHSQAGHLLVDLHQKQTEMEGAGGQKSY